MQQAQVYTTDEDLAVECGKDYATLCPDSQVDAQGRDGVFGAAQPWILTSPTVDFLTWGVHARQVAILTKPSSVFPASTYFAVGGVAPFALQLRRIGKAPGVGQPPGFGGVLGVYFAVATFDPQINLATYQANQRYGIDPARAGRTPDDLLPDDRDDLRDWCNAWILEWAYRQATSSSNSSTDIKHREWRDRFVSLDQRIVLRWGARAGAETAAASGPFSAKVTR